MTEWLPSVVPVVGTVAIGLIGVGSHSGVFSRRRDQRIAGWLVFIIGVGLFVGLIEALIAGVE